MLRRFSALALAGLLVACAKGETDDDDDPPIPDSNLSIAGFTYRLDGYLDNRQVAVPQAIVTPLGLVGVNPVTSGATGDYSIEVPTNGSVLLSVAQQGFWTTYEQLTVGDQDITGRNFLLASNEQVDQMGNMFAVPGYNREFACHAPNSGMCKYAVLMGRVVDDGSSQRGVPAALPDVLRDDFSLAVDGNANWAIEGPFFFTPNGLPNPSAGGTSTTLDASSRLNGGFFALFIEIPVTGPISRNLAISAESLVGGADERYFGPVVVRVFRDAFTWIVLRESGVAPPPPPPPPGEVDFAAQVYPLFLTISQGGFGCLGCHTDQNGAVPAGNFNLGSTAEAAYQAMDPSRFPARVNVQNPGASLVLTKPLYEADGVQNHPIFAFVSDQDPAYRTIFDWISAGARRMGDPPVGGGGDVSFYNDIRPLLNRSRSIGGLGCAECHVDGLNPDNAPGGAYFGGDGNALHTVLTQRPPGDDGDTGEPFRVNKQGNVGASLLLTNPLVGSPEPHPGKIIPNASDPNYQKIFRWIAEGYTNDTPPP